MFEKEKVRKTYVGKVEFELSDSIAESGNNLQGLFGFEEILGDKKCVITSTFSLILALFGSSVIVKQQFKKEL